MPLSIFDHTNFAHYQAVHGEPDRFEHWFGGSADEYGLRFVNLRKPFHVLYRLDTADSAVAVGPPGIRYLPLVYGFHYAAYEGTFVYRVLSDTEIEIVVPEELEYDSDFPYPGHPSCFPRTPVSFRRQAYDRTVAEDALSLVGVFGVGGLSDAELARAAEIAVAEEEIEYSPDEISSDWTLRHILEWRGRAPFMQGAPLKSCTNPNCSAPIAYHADELEIEIEPDSEGGAVLYEFLGGEPLKIEAHDVRVHSMRVIAIHQPDPDDEVIWGDPYVQTIFEICDYCHCLRASNQCT